jgi:hypothetical protein
VPGDANFVSRHGHVELSRLTPAAITLALATISVAALGHSRPDRGEPAQRRVQFAGAFKASGDEQIDHAFVVPAGIAHLDVEISCPPSGGVGTIEFGLRGPGGFRGWTIDGRVRIYVDAISASAGYLPGAIEPGEWHVMLATPQREGAAVAYQVTVRLSNRSGRPQPTLSGQPGWFAGDLHVHSGHSDGYHADALGHQQPVLVTDLAARAAVAGHQFLAITDHNTVSHWLDVDRVQDAHRDVLLLHAREITTPRGHLNAIGEQDYTDFRLGPARPMASLLEELGRDGAFLSINHAWLPSDHWCRGCGWLDRDPGSISRVHGVEVLNGSSPHSGGDMPGWRLWADWLNHGARLVAVGGSDLHDPVNGRAIIGVPSTVVWAASLSEQALVAGLKSGRVYVRQTRRPDAMIDLAARNGTATAAMGQSIGAGLVAFEARVRGAARQRLLWIRRGQIVASVDLSGDEETVPFEIEATAGDWFSVIVRDHGEPSLISNPIYVQ